jgi:hypothetical protein
MQRKIKAGMASAEANYKPRWLPELRQPTKNGVRKRDRRHRTQKILEIRDEIKQNDGAAKKIIRDGNVRARELIKSILT